ncbi:contractile injection system tape measure protein [Undibacterium sp. Ji49W]|uniref:contractile injection system tape measure protein n=1 Tax=Undibacterium sp. Ji49W TaxID=3413040 RepID=UPI003BF32429
MKSFHAIDDLIFDFSFAQGQMEESALSDWISTSIPALIDEVMEQSDTGAGIYRIEKLEIDLGEMTEEELPTELPRRLYAQLSSALSMPREQATEPSIVEEVAADDRQYLEDFLRTGQLAWIASTHPREAHIQLLERVLKNSDAANTMKKIVANEQMRLRLLLQFGEKQLFNVLEKLLAEWPAQLSHKVQQWAQLELTSHSTSTTAAQNYWHWLYQLSAGQVQAMDTALHAWSVSSNKASHELLTQYQQYLEKNSPSPGQEQISLSVLFGDEFITKMLVKKIPDRKGMEGKQAGIQSLEKEISGKALDSITDEVANRQNETTPAVAAVGKGQKHLASDAMTNQSGDNNSQKSNREKPSDLTDTPQDTINVDQLYQALCAGDWSAIKPHWWHLTGKHADLLRRAQAQGWTHWLQNIPAEQLRVASQILQPRASWVLERILNQSRFINPGQAKLWFEQSLPILLSAKPSSLQPDALLIQLPPLRDVAAGMEELHTYLPQISNTKQTPATTGQTGLLEQEDADIDAPSVDKDIVLAGNKKSARKTATKNKITPATSIEISSDTGTASEKPEVQASNLPASTGDATTDNAAISLTQLYKALENADLRQLNPHWERLLHQHGDIIRQAQASAWPAWLSTLPPQKLHDLCLVLQASATCDLEELIDKLPGKLPSTTRQALLASAVPLLLQAAPDSVRMADLLRQLPQLRALEQDSIVTSPETTVTDQVSRATEAAHIDMNADTVTATGAHAYNDNDPDSNTNIQVNVDAPVNANANAYTHLSTDTNVDINAAIDIVKLGAADTDTDTDTNTSTDIATDSKQNPATIELSALSKQFFEALSAVDMAAIMQTWTSASTQKIDSLRQVWLLIRHQQRQEILQSLDIVVLMEWVQILQPQAIQLATELGQQVRRLAQVVQVLRAHKNNLLPIEVSTASTIGIASNTATEAKDTATINAGINTEVNVRSSASIGAESIPVTRNTPNAALSTAEMVEQYAEQLQRKAMQHLLQANTEQAAPVNVIQAMLSDQEHAADIVHIWKKLPDMEQQAKQLHQALQNWPIPDQIATTKNAATQQADVDADADADAPSFMQEHGDIPAPTDIRESGKNQYFSNFRLWVQGQLSLWTLELSNDQLQQWLRWWFASNPQQGQGQDHHHLLFRESVISYFEQAEYPALFMKLVLTQLQQDKEIDLDHLLQESLSLASQEEIVPQGMVHTDQAESRLQPDIQTHNHVHNQVHAQTQNTAAPDMERETGFEAKFNPELSSELNSELNAEIRSELNSKLDSESDSSVNTELTPEYTSAHLSPTINPLLSSDLGKQLLLWLTREHHGSDAAKDISDQQPEFASLLVQLKQDSSILNACNSAQLHQLLLDYLGLEYGDQTRQHFLQSIERYALQSADLHTYLRMVLQDLLAQKIIDLEQILAVSRDADIQLKAQLISAYCSHEVTDEVKDEVPAINQSGQPIATILTIQTTRMQETLSGLPQVNHSQGSKDIPGTPTVPDMQDIITKAQAWNTPALHFWLSQLMASTPQLRATQVWLAALETQINQLAGAKNAALIPYLLLQILMHRQTGEQQQLAFRQAILEYFPYGEEQLQAIAVWLNNDAQALELQQKIDFCLTQADAQARDMAVQGDDTIANTIAATSSEQSENTSADETDAEPQKVAESQANELPRASDEQSGDAHVLYEAVIPGVTPRRSSSPAEVPPDRSVQQLMPNLPHRIAQAMLQANMDSLAPVWTHLMTAERNLLEQGLRRYMVRPEEQRRLLAQTSHDKLRDLIHVLQHQAGSMLDIVWANWNACQASANPSASASALKEKLLAGSFSFLLTSTADTFHAENFLRKLLFVFMQDSSTDAAMLSLAQSWLAHFSTSRPEPLFTALNTMVYGRSYLRVLRQRILPPADLPQAALPASEAEDHPVTTKAKATPATMDDNETSTSRELIISTLSNEFPQLMQEFLQELEQTNLHNAKFTPEEWQHLLYANLNQFPLKLQASFWKQWEEKFFPSGIQRAASDMGIPDLSFLPAGQALLWSAIPEEAYKTSLQDLLSKSKQVAEYARANAAAVSQDALPSTGVTDKTHSYAVKKTATPATSAKSSKAAEIQQIQDVQQTQKDQVRSDVERLAFILQRHTEPDAEQKTIFVLLTQKILVNNTETLKAMAGEVMISALSRPQGLRRLLDILPPLDLKNFLEKLLPAFSQRLSSLFVQLETALGIAIPPLAGFVWRIVYENVFVSHITQPGPAFTQAMVRGLASHYQATDIADLLSKTDDVALQTHRDVTDAPVRSAHAVEQNTPVSENKSGAAKPAEAIQPRKDRPQSGDIPDRADINVDNIHIHNGGLILLAPYIQRLFDILELTRDGNFVDDQSAQRSVHLLQFIVTGELETPEYQLVLNKLLCGIKGGIPICSGISILDREKEVIEQMLEGVIANWGALGGSSIAALRETFLQRQAHLYRQDEAWHMKVLPGTFDMLLDRLPWSFALTRLPWMEEPIHTTWRG